MRDLILLPLALVFSNYCFGISLEGNSAQKVYLTFNEPLTKVSQEWDLLSLKPYIDANAEIELSGASKLGKLKQCDSTKLTGPYTPNLKGKVAYNTSCKFENGVGKVEIQAEFSENNTESKIIVFKVTSLVDHH